MTDDAKYLLDLFVIQYDMFKESMLDKNLRYDKFDRYSYSASAIKLVINDIEECTSYKDVSLIRQILRLHIEMYENFLNNSEHKHECFEYAMKALNYLYSLTEGYVDE